MFVFPGAIKKMPQTLPNSFTCATPQRKLKPLSAKRTAYSPQPCLSGSFLSQGRFENPFFGILPGVQFRRCPTIVFCSPSCTENRRKTKKGQIAIAQMIFFLFGKTIVVSGKTFPCTDVWTKTFASKEEGCSDPPF